MRDAEEDVETWMPEGEEERICGVSAIGFSRRTNSQEHNHNIVHKPLHNGNSSIPGVGVHRSKEGGEVEAGILEIKMAEDARQSRGRK